MGLTGLRLEWIFKGIGGPCRDRTYDQLIKRLPGRKAK